MNAIDELSMREKSALISLLAVLVVYGGYFLDLVRGMAEPTLSAMLYTSVGVIIVLVIIEVVFHAVLGAYERGDIPPADERDRDINRRAKAIGHLVLSVAVILVLGRVVIGGALYENSGQVEVTLYEIANLLLFGLVLSELVYYGAQVWFYRRGVESF